MTTAEILCRLPDRPDVLQTYVWQDFDRAPKFPALCKFLDFWNQKLDGKVHSVHAALAQLVKPPQYCAPGAFITLH